MNNFEFRALAKVLGIRERYIPTPAPRELRRAPNGLLLSSLLLSSLTTGLTGIAGLARAARAADDELGGTGECHGLGLLLESSINRLDSLSIFYRMDWFGVVRG